MFNYLNIFLVVLFLTPSITSKASIINEITPFKIQSTNHKYDYGYFNFIFDEVIEKVVNCANWRLDEQDIYQIINNSFDTEQNDTGTGMDWPCDVTGSFITKGKTWQFRINANSHIFLTNDQGNTYHLGCTKKICRSLFLFPFNDDVEYSSQESENPLRPPLNELDIYFNLNSSL